MSTTASQGTYLPILEQEISATKDKRVNILGFEGHTISVVTTQLCHCRTKAAIHKSKQIGVAMFQTYL